MGRSSHAKDNFRGMTYLDIICPTRSKARGMMWLEMVLSDYGDKIRKEQEETQCSPGRQGEVLTASKKPAVSSTFTSRSQTREISTLDKSLLQGRYNRLL